VAVVAVAHLHGQVLVLGLPDRERLGLRRVDASLWLVDNLALAGQTDGPPHCSSGCWARPTTWGKLAEEIDPASGELLGNVPQAFSHVELISAATNLQRGRRTYRAASG